MDLSLIPDRAQHFIAAVHHIPDICHTFGHAVTNVIAAFGQGSPLSRGDKIYHGVTLVTEIGAAGLFLLTGNFGNASGFVLAGLDKLKMLNQNGAAAHALNALRSNHIPYIC